MSNDKTGGVSNHRQHRSSRWCLSPVELHQKEYAEKVLKIYPRVLMEIERDRGNPTLETFEKIAAPFGLTIDFVTKQRSNTVKPH